MLIRKGVWRFRVAKGKDPLTGKYRSESRTVEAPTLSEARKLRNRALDEVRPVATTTLTVAELFALWLRAKRLEGREAKTVDGYEYRANEISQTLGTIPIQALTRAQVETFYQRLADRDLSARSIDHYHRVLTNALRWAQDQGWLDVVPTRKITKPTPRKHDYVNVTIDQVRAILAAASGYSVEARMFVTLALDLWTRPAETVALRWDKIDTNEATVMIDGAIDSADRSGRRKDTKTHAKRLLAIAPSTADALVDYRQWLHKRAAKGLVTYDDNGYLFSADGLGKEPWHPGRASQMFGRIKKAAGVDSRIRLYDLRHFGATRALASGVSLAQVSYRLGHKLASTTLDHYAHAIPGRDRDIPQLMTDLLATQKELPK